ncbi:hypothetical protein NOK12_06080 [Nocardioides sp. OK12]|nr:hypothetical protein NOK12_06080 [Nocardioides sp. OK12]
MLAFERKIKVMRFQRLMVVRSLFRSVWASVVETPAAPTTLTSPYGGTARCREGVGALRR